jgi:hypothetical protein
VIRGYLAERRILVYYRDGVVRRYVYAGVPQGSVLGTATVNDGVLETLDREKDIEAVAFADDLTVLLKVGESHGIEERMRVAIGMATRWCSEARLHLARGKTGGYPLNDEEDTN